MVSWANPVRGVIHPSSWTRPAGNLDFRLVRRFGDTSVKIGTTYPPHQGIDLGNTREGDPVLAVASGTVTYAAADPASGYAKIVIIDHGSGRRTWSVHLSSIKVSVGQKVSTGTVIGTVGRTGWATAAHLHFQVDSLISGRRVNVDPWPLLAQNQPKAAVYVKITEPGVNVRTKPAVDPTNVYRTSAAGYLIGLPLKLDPAQPYIGGGTYRYGPDGQSIGTIWARVWLNGGYRFLAKPFAHLA